MTPLEDLKNLVSDFPLEPGVYIMKNDKAKVIYVGKAKSLRVRVRSYFHDHNEQSLKTKFLVSHIHHIEYILTKTEVEAFLLEASLIKKFRPRYNIRLKDDKSYPYIKCSKSDDFPRFYVARKVQSDGSIYFGPYTSGMAVRQTIRFLNQTFKIRDCTDVFMKSRTRPCLTHQIGRCDAPCVNLVHKDEYEFQLNLALSFLKGQNQQVIKNLKAQMKLAAQEERFESAAKWRDNLQAVQAIWEKQAVVNTHQEMDQDVIAFVSDEDDTLVEIINVRSGRLIGRQGHFLAKLDAKNEDSRDWLISFLNQYYSDNFIPDQIILPVDVGTDLKKLFEAVLLERGKKTTVKPAVGEEGKRLLDIAISNAQQRFQEVKSEKISRESGLIEMAQKFHLPQIPKRIECYDISNLQGTQIVASQVVFEEGQPKKEDYRLYKIRSIDQANDFASIHEVLSRRLQHREYEDPQLIVVDGGKGQLKMAVTALAELGRSDLPVVGLAKSRTLGDFRDSQVESSPERFFLPGRQNPITFPTRSQAFQILVGIRDEAHRFALNYHQKLRHNQSLQSLLDEISGLGPKRKKLLLEKFSSLEDIKKASEEELSQLPTFNQTLAKKILQHLIDDSKGEE
ncbi:MAG: excinuclease ABC subunit UvrC [Bdellovibrionales bacterium]|nr:excinuclease ABC subunit UvrC [Bdellovibrionales bacterium]